MSLESILVFDGSSQDYIVDAKFESNDGSVKYPSGTTHHLYLGDSIKIQSSTPASSKYKAILKYKSFPNDIVVTETNFRDTNDNLFSCTLQIPRTSNHRIMGTSPSRVAYINIVDKFGRLINQSSTFWIKSRTRCQTEKDAQKKKRPLDSSDSSFSEETDSSSPSLKKTKIDTNVCVLENQESVQKIQSHHYKLPSINELLTDNTDDEHICGFDDSIEFADTKKIFDDFKTLMDTNMKMIEEINILTKSVKELMAKINQKHQ